MRWIAPNLICVSIWALASLGAHADEALVAVAANFAEAAEQLKADFETTHQHRLVLTVGSTGKLYAQIRNGAPVDVLLAADDLRPRLLEEEGRAVAGSRFTYAVGRLVLWSASGTISANGAETLRAGEFRRLAMANPDLAPYGAAARAALQSLELEDELRDRIVLGENAGQAFALVATGNAEVGLVALSSVLSRRNEETGSHWELPPDLHPPIRQDAVLLSRGVDNSAAVGFLGYLRTAAARTVIRRMGYATE